MQSCFSVSRRKTSERDAAMLSRSQTKRREKKYRHVSVVWGSQKDKRKKDAVIIWSYIDERIKRRILVQTQTER